jgi:pre-mRNA-processing factor 17
LVSFTSILGLFLTLLNSYVQAARDERIAERKAREKGMPEATSQFHAKADTDYQGRTWIECPSDLKRQSELASVQSYIPKNCVHTWTGHTAGVHAIRWFPKTGHLLLSASMDNKVKIWDVYNNRKCMRTYNGHTKPVRDVTFSQDGRQFVSAGYDRVVRYWDTETGACLNAWKAKGIPYQCKIHPGDDNILAACSDKNIVQWDPRQSTDDSLVQEYIQHLGSVNTINFYDDYRRVVSTGGMS